MKEKKPAMVNGSDNTGGGDRHQERESGQAAKGGFAEHVKQRITDVRKDRQTILTAGVVFSGLLALWKAFRLWGGSPSQEREPSRAEKGGPAEQEKQQIPDVQKHRQAIFGCHQKRESGPAEKDGSAKEGKGLIHFVRTHRQPILAVVGGLPGLWALYEAFSLWGFGSPIPPWLGIVAVVSLGIVWLFALCRCVWDLANREDCMYSWNTLLAVIIPMLVMSVLFARLAYRWRLSEKTVILVEASSGSEGTTDHVHSAARLIKDGIERNIRPADRPYVKVILGKGDDKPARGDEKSRSQEIPILELALHYRADMIVSVWQATADANGVISVNFHVVRAPPEIPREFITRREDRPEPVLFNEKDVENFTVPWCAAKDLQSYECGLMIGAGAYASHDWERAEWYFRRALKIIEPKPECTSGSPRDTAPGAQQTAVAAHKKASSWKYLQGDEALLNLYLAHCLFNRGNVKAAVATYDEALRIARTLEPADTRRRAMLGSIHLGRGIAHRTIDEYVLATDDLRKAASYLRSSRDSSAAPRADAGQDGMDVVRWQSAAAEHYSEGEKYLIMREYPHAEEHFKIAADIYRFLAENQPESEPPAPGRGQQSCRAKEPLPYRLRLARTFVRLGEVHKRKALSVARSDVDRDSAIKLLKEAIRITREFPDQRDSHALRIRAEAYRHLGEAYCSLDEESSRQEACRLHKEAVKIWESIPDVNEAAVEQVRVGIAYRQLSSLLDDEPRKQSYHREEIYHYRQAAEALIADRDHAEALLSVLGGIFYTPDPNALKGIWANRTAHHLGNAVLNIAEAEFIHPEPDSHEVYHACRPLAYAVKWYEKAKKQMKVYHACGLLAYAVACYAEAEKRMRTGGKECDGWYKQVHDKERNESLEDDLAWCRTLYGYALLKRAMLKRPGDSHDCDCREAIRILAEANAYLRNGRDSDDQGFLVVDLFSLGLSRAELRETDLARNRLRAAFGGLRDMERTGKRLWYAPHLCNMMDDLSKLCPDLGMADKKTDMTTLKAWLQGDSARKGRLTLDAILRCLDEEAKDAGKAND
jgi:tetratricopeptide (TPR) repeat protein